MATGDLSSATTTNFKGRVPDFIVESKRLDAQNDNGKTYVYFEKATENYGYYFNFAQVSSPINALATWAVSRGYTTQDKETKQILEHVTGMGKDTFETVMWNHEATKLIQGDAFIHAPRDDKGVIVNMINISPERVRIEISDGRIKSYGIWDGKEWKEKKVSEILHSHNKRIGDQVHGTSQIQSNKGVYDTMLEAYNDERVIKHRDKALGIVYYKTNNEGKITYANKQIENAVRNGEMVGLPEDTAKIEPYPSKSSEDRQNWLQYNENLGYQVGGVPRSIATSDGTSEVGGKMGHVIFEPIYTKEQRDLENELWSQLSVRIKFNRPPMLGGLQPEMDMSKNTGQQNIQPNDVSVTMNRE